MTNWNETRDVIVIGSGGGGMTAALVAAQAGLDTLIIEKSEFYGGSTALSGGGLWIPNNYLLQQDGLDDSFEKARTYMQSTVGDRVPQIRKDAYLQNAPEMIKYLVTNSQVRFQRAKNYADYYPERPGGMADGRALEAVPFDGRALGNEFKNIRTGSVEPPAGLAFSVSEYNKIGMVMTTWRGRITAAKVGVRTVFNILTGVKYSTLGKALIGRLRRSLLDENVPLQLNTGLKELVFEDGRVVGIVAECDGRPIRIQARKGVIMAAGGFAHNQEMRDEFQPKPLKHEWSSANPANTGDAIQLGIQAGAAIDLMDDAWWGPTSMMPEQGPMFHVGERAYPGGIMVNGAGKRFTNESAGYTEVVHAMYEQHSDDNPHVPATFIFDQRYRSKYIFGMLFPGQPIPQKMLDSGYIKTADTIEALAEKCGVDPQGLAETIARFNRMAKAGVDEDFQRGDSAYDRYYGDPSVKPNPCLAPIAKSPFYAVEFVAGDLGTKGGLVTDEFARVVRGDGSVIDGLYAIGNNSSSVMGNTYPGAGSTIGPAMTFGYVAAKHLAEGKIRPIGSLPASTKSNNKQLAAVGVVGALATGWLLKRGK